MKKITIVLFLSFLFLQIKAQDYHVRFGFLGNSITMGAGLGNPKEQCYPAQMANLLQEKYGDTCIVGNYAVSGRTMLKNGDFPLWNEALFQKGWIEAPDICFICLGTNDTKPYNWDVYGHEFHPDYLAMMDTFKLRNPKVKFMICYPPPAFDVVWDIRPEIVTNGVIPVVDSVLTEREAILVDFYNPLLDSAYLFPDKIHPNAAGAKVMAKIAFDKIVESDIIHSVVTNSTFVTNVETENDEIRKGDSVTISWITRNATEVYLNGISVELTGSKKVAPEETTDYWVVAKGPSNTDSLMVKQLVYVHELHQIAIDPNRFKMKQGEKADFKVLYYDQRMTPITNEVYPSSWQIIEGNGTFSNESDTMVTYTATDIGKTKLQVTVGELTATVSITVEEGTNVTNLQNKTAIGYPNPCESYYLIESTANKNDFIEMNIYNSEGKLVSANQTIQFNPNNSTIKLDTRQLQVGVYLYDVVFKEELIRGKFIKK